MQDKISPILDLLSDTLELISDNNKTRILSITKTKLEESQLCLVSILGDFNSKYISSEIPDRFCGKREKLIIAKVNIDKLLLAIDIICNNGEITTKRGIREKAEIAYDNILLAGIWITEELKTKEEIKKEEVIIKDNIIEKETFRTKLLNIFK